MSYLKNIVIIVMLVIVVAAVAVIMLWEKKTSTDTGEHESVQQADSSNKTVTVKIGKNA